MYEKLAFAQKVLRALAGEEKTAGLATPLLLGAGAVGAAHVVGSGLKKGKDIKAGFAPGVAESRIH